MCISDYLQAIYIETHARSLIPVLLNDVVFAAHAFICCLITGLQCFIYEVCVELFILLSTLYINLVARQPKSLLYMPWLELFTDGFCNNFIGSDASEHAQLAAIHLLSILCEDSSYSKQVSLRF